MTQPGPVPDLPAKGDPVLGAIDVTRRFELGKTVIEVLRGVNLTVRAGECLFLRGASGAGKTSLLYTLAGLEAPNSGRIEVMGRSLYQLGRRSQAKLRNGVMGYVFQNYALLPELTAVENVMIPAMIGGRKARSRAEELLQQVGLGSRLDHLPNELSGGEQQRVAIARALVNDPAILFADEPTGNLDAKTGKTIIDLLVRVVHEQNKALVVVTHDSTLAEAGDRTLVLAEGRIAD